MAHHALHQGRLTQALHGQHIDQTAVTQHGHTLSHALQFFQPVRDIDQGHALGLHQINLGKQMLDLFGREHGRGFIEHQHAVAVAQIARNLHHLLHANAELANGRERVDMFEAHLGQLHARLLGKRVVVDPAKALGQAVEQQVLGHGKRGHQTQLLQHHAHAQAFGLGARAWGKGLSIQRHAPAGWRDQPAQHLGQRAFACPVLARQRQAFACSQVERDAVEHGAGTIVLAHAFQRQHRAATGRIRRHALWRFCGISHGLTW